MAMSQSSNSAALELRVRHYQGERLLARDLQDEYDTLTRLREAHVVALHDTWGIRLGYDVRLGSQSSLWVGPGAAYDARGRQLILAQLLRLPLPQVLPHVTEQEQRCVLVMRYDCNLGRSVTDQAWIPCSDEVGREAPLFGWLPDDQVRLGLDVPLVGVWMIGGKLDEGKGLDFSVRHYAQPLARSHAGGGFIARPSWSLWETEVSGNLALLGVQTVVDTSDAGFVSTPFYFASASFTDLTLFTHWVTGQSFLLLPSITDTSAASFRLRLLIAGEGQRERGALSEAGRLFAATRTTPPTIAVSWIGIEPMTPCTPEIDWVGALAELGERLVEVPRIGVVLPIINRPPFGGMRLG